MAPSTIFSFGEAMRAISFARSMDPDSTSPALELLVDLMRLSELRSSVVSQSLLPAADDNGPNPLDAGVLPKSATSQLISALKASRTADIGTALDHVRQAGELGGEPELLDRVRMRIYLENGLSARANELAERITHLGSAPAEDWLLFGEAAADRRSD